MAVNLNSNAAAYQNVAQVFNSNTRVNDAARQKTPQLPAPEQTSQNLPQPQKVKTDQKVVQALDAQRDQDERHRTTFDNPNRTTAKALNAYNSVANADRKEEIHSLLGVDLYV